MVNDITPLITPLVSQIAPANVDAGYDIRQSNCLIPSSVDEFSYNVQNKIKLETFSNEYIDLGILLTKPVDLDDMSKNISVKKGSL